MERASCAQLRANTYYFRRRLPRDVAGLLCRGEVVRSLKTSHPDVAAQRVKIVAAVLERAITLLRETDPQDIATARLLFRRWFEGQLEKDFRQRQAWGSGPKIVPKSRVTGASEETAVKIGQRFLRTQREIEAGFIADRLLKDTHHVADRNHLVTLILHGLHELQTQIYPRRDQGDFSDKINDRLVKQAFEEEPERTPPPPAPAPAPQTSEPPGLGLADAIDRFVAEQRPAVIPKTLVEYEQTFRLARDFWGTDVPVGSIKKAAARDFKDLLLKLPANMTQRFPGKTLQEAVEAGAQAGFATISPKTINKKISNLSYFFSWLKDQGYVEDNPFSGLSVKDDSSRRKRDPFSAITFNLSFLKGFLPWALLTAQWRGLANAGEFLDSFDRPLHRHATWRDCAAWHCRHPAVARCLDL